MIYDIAKIPEHLKEYFEPAPQIGLEPTLDEFIDKMVEVFEEVRRVLRSDGVCWVNMGDSYNAGTSSSRKQSTDNDVGGWQSAGTHGDRRVKADWCKTKDRMLVPWRLVLALQAAGWYVRDVIVWHKPAPMPESVTDRCTQSWEPIFLLTKSPKYFYDAEAVKEDSIHAGREVIVTAKGFAGQATGAGINGTGNAVIGSSVMVAGTRNLRNVWTLSPEPFPGAHFATFPTELPRRCIKAGTSEHGCCPKCGAPWKRITEREQLKRERPNEYVKRDGAEGTGNSCANTVAGVAVTTKGWEPTCKCNAGDAIPCVVMDIFNGSGTSGLVARRLGRRYVGFELNPDYAAMARERITSDAPLFNEAV